MPTYVRVRIACVVPLRKVPIRTLIPLGPFAYGLRRAGVWPGESDERNKVLKRLHSAYLLDPEFLNNREY